MSASRVWFASVRPRRCQCRDHRDVLAFRRAIDIHEGDKINEAALKDLIRAAVALNLKEQNQAEARRASGKRAEPNR